MAIQNEKKVTMEDIAKRLNISKNAVSLALNNKPGVSEKLRQRIVRTATELNYGSFSTQLDNKSKCILVIVPEYIHNDTFFYSDIFWAIEQEAKRQGYLSFTSSISYEAEKKLTLPLIPQELNVIGLLVIGVIRDDYLRCIYEMGLPVVTVDITYHNIPVNSIASSNIAGAYDGTSYLVECGHTDIGFIGPVYTAQSVYERWCGFHQAILKHNLTDHNGYHIFGANDHFELLDTTSVLETYLDKVDRYPTAWFCAGDRIAIALISLLNKKNISVPNDISVMGFDDISVSHMISPPLTTIRVDRKLMGELAVKRLTDQRIFHINLPGALIIRDSVRRIRP